jgi:L-amino acid N-acyltransferase YncA
MIIRDATPGDAKDITEIYGHHVLHGTATFDTEPPSFDHWQNRIAEIRGKLWPFVVAEREGTIVGYAYAMQFRDRPAYVGTCENSVYVSPDAMGVGVGTALMTALIERTKPAGFFEIIAVIGGGEPASVALHARAGFVQVGHLKNVGRKFGRLLDTVYMQRSL